MKTIILAIAAAAALSACSTLNNYGIGGEPLLVCKSRDATAFLDDRVLGSVAVHGSLVRRFADGDSLCAALMKPAALAPAPAANAPK